VNDGFRTYYDDIPDIIQIGNHQFVEYKVVCLWQTDMNLAWKSATNCARSYQYALAKGDGEPGDWKYGSLLKPSHIYDAFVIYSLLEFHQTRQSTLVVPHVGDQSYRLIEAMRARNAIIRLYGQPEIRHYCNKCIRVMDGL